MRGHLIVRKVRLSLLGTIPAGAGTPPLAAASCLLSEDYPRGCGDTTSAVGGIRAAHGLSPRVRGHPPPPAATASVCGTIPAGAGTPSMRVAGRRRRWDYPRGCGDTVASSGKAVSFAGLSPRVRGHQNRAYRSQSLSGTIPAGAGTPIWMSSWLASSRDYPRGCGDTSSMIGCTQSAGGLSPRVRGHHRRPIRRSLP